MRKLILLMVALAVSYLGECSAQPKAVEGPSATSAGTFSWRFAGLNALKKNTNLIVLHEITALKEFEGFRSNLTARVTAILARKAGATNDAELMRLIEPLAADVIAYPTVFEHGGAGASNICSLAIQLPPDRHAIWKDNWDAVLKKVKIEGATLTREGPWTFVSNGPGRSALNRIRKPTQDVAEFNGDAPLLKQLLPGLEPQKVSLKVTAQNGALRSEGKVTFDKDLDLKLKPWKIPVNTIREPILGFTAIQGIVKDRLSPLPFFKNHPAPDQLFFWSENVTPFTIYAAARVDDPNSFIKDLLDGVDLKASGKKIEGRLEMNTNTPGIFLRGLPLAVPFILPAHTNDAGFVFAGLMPMGVFSPKRMPDELANELTSRTNLIFYDWELTWLRLKQLRPALQILAWATRKNPPMFGSPMDNWLQVSEKLGNAVTEISQTGPRELMMVRRSDVGFSAWELNAISQWISGPQPVPTHLKTKTPAPSPAP